MRDHPATTPTLRVNLTLPSTKLTFRAMIYDPLKEMLGFDPRSALVSLLRSEPYIRTTGGGPGRCYRLSPPSTRCLGPRWSIARNMLVTPCYAASYRTLARATRAASSAAPDTSMSVTGWRTA